jgi:5'-deoxynucleotidase YfbR-like HD superfamily hydrolase
MSSHIKTSRCFGVISAQEEPRTTSAASASEGLRYLNLIGHLKNTPRTGWVYNGVGNITRVESVADHSWRMSAAAFIFADDPQIDVGKMIRLAVVHDMAEVNDDFDLTPPMMEKYQ